ncbi:MAG: hypothetical protein WBV53_07070 [Solirubrobacterales bacterium]
MTLTSADPINFKHRTDTLVHPTKAVWYLQCGNWNGIPSHPP